MLSVSQRMSCEVGSGSPTRTCANWRNLRRFPVILDHRVIQYDRKRCRWPILHEVWQVATVTSKGLESHIWGREPAGSEAARRNHDGYGCLESLNSRQRRGQGRRGRAADPRLRFLTSSRNQEPPICLVMHSNADPDTVFLVDLFTGAAGSRHAHEWRGREADFRNRPAAARSQPGDPSR